MPRWHLVASRHARVDVEAAAVEPELQPHLDREIDRIRPLLGDLVLEALGNARRAWDAERAEAEERAARPHETEEPEAEEAPVEEQPTFDRDRLVRLSVPLSQIGGQVGEERFERARQAGRQAALVLQGRQAVAPVLPTIREQNRVFVVLRDQNGRRDIALLFSRLDTMVVHRGRPWRIRWGAHEATLDGGRASRTSLWQGFPSAAGEDKKGQQRARRGQPRPGEAQERQ